MPCADLATTQQLIDIYNALGNDISSAANQTNGAIDNLSNQLIEIRDRVNQIYQILGGDGWYAEESYSPKMTVDFDAIARGSLAKLFSHNETGTEYESKEATCNSLPDFILGTTAATYLRLGLDDFPQKVPIDVTSSNYPIDDNEAYENSHTTIPTLTQFNRWQFKQLDALFGRFPIKIDIEDNDLVQTGAQTAEIRLPNVAETLAELTGKIIQNDAKVNALLNVVMRLMVETATDKLTNVKTHYMVDAITEYINFKDKKSKVKVPFTFDLSKFKTEGEDGELQDLNAKLSDFLQMTEYDVEVDEYDDDTTLEEELRILIEAARIIKAVYFEKIDGGDIDSLKESLRQKFTDLADNLFETEGRDAGDDNFSNDPSKTPKERRQEDFDTYLENVEQGFIKEAPDAGRDSTKPFGKPWDRRPRIREIGKQGDLT